MGIKRSPADIAFAKACYLRDDYTCQKCGKKGRVEASHVKSRTHRTIRWDLLNIKALCHTCHRWWHSNPTESGLWFINTFGQWREDILLEKMRNRVKVSKLEEKEIAKHYREQCRLKEENPEHELVSWQ